MSEGKSFLIEVLLESRIIARGMIKAQNIICATENSNPWRKHKSIEHGGGCTSVITPIEEIENISPESITIPPSITKPK